ncbi:hypothetical protein SKAU_G00158170 [Synaphobranchus kaupii]|uniref:Uncharacterized protein n=1 Tax=Synaphobranchus kaupii TaxID=118154 RepID=A0A9Q1FIF4_SYNKA|nr:hypothetical protein SKAU_G00158170 [Synaphobranchus kaupii]
MLKTAELFFMCSGQTVKYGVSNIAVRPQALALALAKVKGEERRGAGGVPGARIYSVVRLARGDRAVSQCAVLSAVRCLSYDLREVHDEARPWSRKRSGLGSSDAAPGPVCAFAQFKQMAQAMEMDFDGAEEHDG